MDHRTGAGSVASAPSALPAMPVLPITSQDTLKHCKGLKLKDTDVFICSYPKSGTTWTQAIVAGLLRKGNMSFDHVSDVSPFFEIDAHWEKGELAPCVLANFAKLGRRAFNTHLRWDMMPHGADDDDEGKGAKFIYVIRDGRDVVCSFYHHLSNQADSGGFEGTWEEFYSQWLKGEVAFGKWSHHIQSWMDARDDSRVLFIHFADMKRDLESCVKQIAKHLDLHLSDKEVSELLPLFSFQYMKEHKAKFQPKSVGWKKGYEFIRKGKVGDHASLFGEVHAERYAAMLAEDFPQGLPDCLRPQ